MAEVGRPTAMTETVLRKLEEAFALGCSDREAAFYADIAPSTIYKYCTENPDFSERKEALKKRPIYLARKVVVQALEDNDIASAHKVLDRHDGSKVSAEISGPDGSAIQFNFVGVPSDGRRKD